MSVNYSTDRRVIREQLNLYVPPIKIHNPRPVHIVADGTYFGERKEDTSWCTIAVRDPIKQEDLVWVFTNTETTYVYCLLRDELEALGYIILSVTSDGFKGIKTAFSGIPWQMCHVHMERRVIEGTTRKPQTEAGEVLLALTRTLFKGTSNKVFNRRLNQFIAKYRNFLNEKTIHPVTGDWSWTHEGVRYALGALIRQRHNLFTFEQNKNIPKDTNSIEGHFTHMKKMVAVHDGLSRPHKEKVLHSILLASTTAPKVDKLDEIL
ncbi:transposase [Patescibacteria group bacterium]|nr:transposase [Patescibacteria group bacterium]MBU4453313.1 transposase [Patescibacteria group bacterium]MCG2687271.1 transposase [Candidatus Parcubacteria bacterium]